MNGIRGLNPPTMPPSALPVRFRTRQLAQPPRPQTDVLMKRFQRKVFAESAARNGVKVASPERSDTECRMRDSSEGCPGGPSDSKPTVGTLLGIVKTLLVRHEIRAAVLLLNSLTSSPLARSELACSASAFADQLDEFLDQNRFDVSRSVVDVLHRSKFRCSNSVPPRPCRGTEAQKPRVQQPEFRSASVVPSVRSENTAEETRSPSPEPARGRYRFRFLRVPKLFASKSSSSDSKARQPPSKSKEASCFDDLGPAQEAGARGSSSVSYTPERSAGAAAEATQNPIVVESKRSVDSARARFTPEEAENWLDLPNTWLEPEDEGKRE